ncbi:MAG: carbohydrate porin [Candidatus Omnitrophica bacterium]|nr:carbohydrate porin [Candidatus Omnitrophota bacterium]
MNRGKSFLISGIGLLSAMFFLKPAQAAGEWLLKSQRAVLEEKGLTLRAKSIEDFVSVLHGGISHKDTWNGLLDFGVNYDFGKLGIIPGGTFFFRGAEIHGNQRPTVDLVGDAQGVDGFEGAHGFRVYEMGYEQNLLKDKLSLRAGVLDINSDFAFSDIASVLFMNSALCITPTLVNNISTPTYPITAAGFRTKYAITENITFMAGVWDGDAGTSEDNKHNLHIKWKNKDGLLSITQTDFKYILPGVGDKLPGTFKLGGWYDSKSFNDVVNTDDNGDAVRHHGNFGGYFIWDQMLWREKDDQGLSMFWEIAGAPKDRNTVSQHLAGGFTYTGLVPGRDQDQCGIAVTNAYFSHQKALANDWDRAEATWETTYRVKVNESVSVAPDFEYVDRPSGDRTKKNASVFMIRTMIVY